jgi:hypothetical protein
MTLPTDCLLTVLAEGVEFTQMVVAVLTVIGRLDRFYGVFARVASD